MSQRNVPEELNARRDKILSLYKDGLSVADIARYFEVTPANILSSFSAIGLSPDKNRISGSISDFRKEKKKGKMDQILEARDASLLSLTEEEILRRGFWKRPLEYQKAKQKQNKEMALQTELRMIGFRKKDICKYMGYDSTDQVKAVRHNTDDFLVIQQNLAFQYYKNKEINSTWTCDEIVEFCGICITRIITHEKVESEKQRNRREELEKTMQEIYSLYYKDKLSQQAIAEKLGLSRRTVITYLKNYQDKNDIEAEKKKHYPVGYKKKKITEEDIERIKNYLVKNENGTYVCRQGVSHAFIAKELHFTEVTIVKYIKVINNRER